MISRQNGMFNRIKILSSVELGVFLCAEQQVGYGNKEKICFAITGGL